MSELINNSRKRRDTLKHLILELHKGVAPEAVRSQVSRLLGEVPYGEVVQVEQELISEGLPQEEVLHLCDLHTEALKGHIDQSAAKSVLPGHPVHTFKEENRALESALSGLSELFQQVQTLDEKADPTPLLSKIHLRFNELMDVDKHYRRKEYLLFPYLEKHEITGPPTVMWGKHDQTRALLKSAQEALAAAQGIRADEAKAIVQLLLRPAGVSVDDMIYKEEQILFPMCLDILTDSEWYDVAMQSPEIGFCLFDPKDEWIPEGLFPADKTAADTNRIVFPTGSFTLTELNAMLNTLPIDMTFVDQEDTVRYFSQGAERIFDRNRTILGRRVQNCHPPTSVHIVNQIVEDFRSGRQSKAEFWITLHGKFIFISYYAVRSEDGKYLGTVEMTMDLTRLRKLEGEQRLLSYGDTAKGNDHE
jgi:DUF438 domain-containing protein